MEKPKLLTTTPPRDETIIVKIENCYHIGWIGEYDDQIFTESKYDVFPLSKLEGWYPLPE